MRACYNLFMYLVSACLAGFNTRYDGGNALNERVRSLISAGKAVPVCPEQLAGLPTPRKPMEFDSGDGSELLDGGTMVVDADGADMAKALLKGSEEVLRIARLFGVTEAVLKDGSPSCGTTYVYVRGSKREGKGVCAEVLQRNGIKVRSDDSI